jgi:hypothetical protein
VRRRDAAYREGGLLLFEAMFNCFIVLFYSFCSLVALANSLWPV